MEDGGPNNDMVHLIGAYRTCGAYRTFLSSVKFYNI